MRFLLSACGIQFSSARSLNGFNSFLLSQLPAWNQRKLDVLPVTIHSKERKKVVDVFNERRINF